MEVQLVVDACQRRNTLTLVAEHTRWRLVTPSIDTAQAILLALTAVANNIRATRRAPCGQASLYLDR